MRPLEFDNPAQVAALVEIWNAACGPDLALNEKLVRNNLRPNTGITRDGFIVLKGGRALGFVIVSADRAARLGWVEALAVHPLQQRLGHGHTLMEWAERWFKSQGCKRVRLGGGLRPFAPGVPTPLNTMNFFEGLGFKRTSTDWDVARRLNSYVPQDTECLKDTRCVIRPASNEDVPAMSEFFARAFPGRWKYEFEELVREGGRLSDFLILRTERGVDGFIQLSFEEGSYRPIERFYMHRLPHPWGQAGPLGVSSEVRGKGYGLAIIDAGLRHLKEQGVDGCLIDWTSLTDLYGKFGFEKYREYAIMVKEGE